jgi:hypothetical protein
LSLPLQAGHGLQPPQSWEEPCQARLDVKPCQDGLQESHTKLYFMRSEISHDSFQTELGQAEL